MVAFRECCYPGHLTYAHFLPFVATLLYLLISELYRNEPHPLKNWAYAFAAQLYIALPFSMIFLLGVHYDPAAGTTSFNGWLPLSVFFFLWTSDTGAYLCGSTFSRFIPAKLFPRISPNKSWDRLRGWRRARGHSRSRPQSGASRRRPSVPSAGSVSD